MGRPSTSYPARNFAQVRGLHLRHAGDDLVQDRSEHGVDRHSSLGPAELERDVHMIGEVGVAEPLAAHVVEVLRHLDDERPRLELELVLDERADERLARHVAHAAELAEHAGDPWRLHRQQSAADPLALLEHVHGWHRPSRRRVGEQSPAGVHARHPRAHDRDVEHLPVRIRSHRGAP